MKTRMTQKELRELVKRGAAIDVTRETKRNAIAERYDVISRSFGVNGMNGLLLQGESGQLYAVVCRCMSLYVFDK